MNYGPIYYRYDTRRVEDIKRELYPEIVEAIQEDDKEYLERLLEQYDPNYTFLTPDQIDQNAIIYSWMKRIIVCEEQHNLDYDDDEDDLHQLNKFESDFAIHMKLYNYLATKMSYEYIENEIIRPDLRLDRQHPTLQHKVNSYLQDTEFDNAQYFSDLRENIREWSHVINQRIKLLTFIEEDDDGFEFDDDYVNFYKTY